MKEISTVSATEQLFKGAQDAVRQAIEKAKRTNRTFSRDGKPVHVKACDL